jgi:hypothetical protein
MQCKEIQSLMIEDIYNEIEPNNKKLLQQHLNQCERCQTEFRELKDTTKTLKLLKDEESGAIELPPIITTHKSKKRIFYRIATVAASILIILSVINLRISIDSGGFDISFNFLGLNSGTDTMAANIIENGSQVEQLQLMTQMIQAANDQQRQEIVTLLTDFYQAVEMRRQADLKVISQNMETLQSVSNQRIEETHKTMQDLIQYTGSILDKGNYIKAVETK